MLSLTSKAESISCILASVVLKTLLSTAFFVKFIK
uniref:Uncharacterized protein n=1 Tax=Anguilla anguilla TaxID=7936 RepID=A0A0E9RE61_ANGAN